jgi:hypothetical protein
MNFVKHSHLRPTEFTPPRTDRKPADHLGYTHVMQRRFVRLKVKHVRRRAGTLLLYAAVIALIAFYSAYLASPRWAAAPR